MMTKLKDNFYSAGLVLILAPAIGIILMLFGATASFMFIGLFWWLIMLFKV